MAVPRTHLEAFLDRVRAQTTRPVGPPPTQSEQALIEQLKGHVEHEKEALEAYEQLAATSPDEHVRYLAHMVLDDEAHHHRVLAEMLNRVRSDAEWRPVEPNVPRVRTPQDSRALLEATARLIKTEREDLRQVRALKRRLRPQRRTSMLWLMADVLELDTRKHLRILQFLRRTARD